MKYRWKKICISFLATALILMHYQGGSLGLLSVKAVSAGQNLSSGTYDVTSNITAGAGTSGLKITSGATVTLNISGNITIRGGNASGSTGAGAGIEVPSNSKLYIRGSGKLTVIGGNAASGGNGARAQGYDNNWSCSKCSVPNDRHGAHGAGGYGGGGAGAGIGGRGGNGGSSNGAGGESGGSMGTVFALGDVNITTTGGSGGSYGGSGGAGGFWSLREGPTALYDDWAYGGGGGGGGGGAGYPAASFGGGGGGGSAGADGANGGYSGEHADGGDVHAGGGNGGGHGYGYRNGSDGKGGAGYSAGGGSDGSNGVIFMGGDGGSGGNLYKSTHNTYSISRGGGSGDYNGGGGSTYTAYDARDLTASISSCTFNGSAQTPSVSLSHAASSTNINSNGYTISKWADNTNATTSAKVTIKGNESTSAAQFVTGEDTKNFTINRASLSLGTSGDTSAVYRDTKTATLSGVPSNRGSGGDITWSVVQGSATLSNATSSTVTYVPTSTGTLKLRASVSQSTNYASNYVEKTIAVSQASSSSLNIAAVPDQTYTGSEIKPTPVVKYSDYTLAANEKSYTYGNNVNVGTASLTVNGLVNFSGSKSTSFHIVQADIANATIANISDQTYTGKNIQPDPVVTFGGKTVSKEDYTVTYKNQINQGTATLTITGKRNFKGSQSKNYKIIKKAINASDVTLTKPVDQIFEGKELTPKPALVYNGIPLNEGSDYTLEYENNKFVGTATVTITGINNFSGSRTTTFKIDKRTVYVDPDANQKKTYGTADPSVYTYTHSNDCVGYTATFTGALSRVAGEDKGQYEIQQGTLALSQESQKYYVLNYRPKNFIIEAWHADDVSAYLVGDKERDENEWYWSIVEITAPAGYTLSKNNAIDGEWSDHISFLDGDYATNGVNYYLKRDTDNAISEIKNIKYRQDTKNPSGSIIIREDAFTQMISDIAFKLFFNMEIDARLKGADSLSGVREIKYIESERELSREELDAIKDKPFDQDDIDPQATYWTTSSTATIANEKGILYMKVIDTAGNYIYVNTDGIIYDRDDPLLSGEYAYDGRWTKEADPQIHGTVSDELAGLKDRYAAYSYLNKTQILQIDEDGHFQFGNLPDGDYELQIEATDKAGNHATPLSFHIMKDTEQPKLVLHADTVTIASSQKITFDPTTGCSGVARIEIYDPEHDTWSTVENAMENGFTADKSNHIYRFRVIDNALGISEPVDIEFTNIDTAIPKAEVWALYPDGTSYEEESYTNEFIQVNFKNRTDNLGTSKYEYRMDGGEWKMADVRQGVALVPPLETEGIHTFDVRITSQAGIEGESESFVIALDTTPPDVSLNVNSSLSRRLFNAVTFDTFFKDTQTVTITKVDPISGGLATGIRSVEYFVYQSEEDEKLTDIPSTKEEIEQFVDGKWKNGNYVTLDPNRSYVVFAKVCDNAGNITYQNTQGLIVDSRAPEISISFDENGVWTHDARVEIEAKDNLSEVYKMYTKTGDEDFKEVAFDHGKLVLNGFDNGEHEIQVKVEDHAGNAVISDTISVKEDHEVPTLAVNGEEDVTSTSRNVTLQAAHAGLSGLAAVQVKLDDGEWQDITDTYEDGFNIKENGTWTFRAVSNAGKSTEQQITYENIFTNDLNPTLKLMSADGSEIQDGGWGNGQVRVEMSNDPKNVKGIKYFYKLDDDQDWQEVSVTNGLATLTIAEEGTHTIYFKEQTEAGDLESDPVSMSFTSDMTPPVITIQAKDSIWTSRAARDIDFDTVDKETVPYEVSAQDSYSGMKKIDVYIDQSEEGKRLEQQYTAADLEDYVDGRWTNTVKGSLRPGKSYIIYVKAMDQAGNVQYFSSKGIIVDDLRPGVSSVHKEEDWVVDNNDTIDILIEEELAGIDYTNSGLMYKINDHAWKSVDQLQDGKLPIKASELEEGSNIIRVQVKDTAGNEAEEYTLVVKKDTVTPSVMLRKEKEAGYEVENLLKIECNSGESGIQKVEILENNEWIDITDTYMQGFEPKNNAIYTVRMSDGAGRTASEDITFADLDVTVPLIGVQAMSDGNPYTEGSWTAKDVTIHYSNLSENEGPLTYEHQIDGKGFVKDEAHNSIASFDLQEEGMHEVELRIRNKTGLKSEILKLAVSIDKTGPKARVEVSEGLAQKQLVNVVAEDTGSGLDTSAAYSFDGGTTWQAENMLEITENTILDICVRDAVGNVTSLQQKVEVDTKAPEVENAKMDTEDWAVEKHVRAVVKDAPADDVSSTSGIATVFLTSRNPYKDGKLTRVMPTITDYVMEKEYDDIYKTVSPIRENIGIMMEDNFWIIAVDKAGNAVAYTMKIDKIMLEDDKEPDVKPDPKPTPKPDTKPNQNQGDHSQNGSSMNQNGGSQNKPGNHDSNSPSYTAPNKNQTEETIKKEITDGIDQLEKVSVDAKLSNEEKLSKIEDVLTALLKNIDLSNNERMVILSTMDQVKKAQKLNSKAETVYKDAGTTLTDTQSSMEALDEIDKLLDEKQPEVTKHEQRYVLVVAAVAMLIVAGLGCFVVLRRTRKKYGKAVKGGGQNE